MVAQRVRDLAIVGTGSAAADARALVALAVLVDLQADRLGARSEVHGGFDAGVFPPYSGAIRVLANAGAILSLAGVPCAVILLRSARRSTR